MAKDHEVFEEVPLIDLIKDYGGTEEGRPGHKQKLKLFMFFEPYWKHMAGNTSRTSRLPSVGGQTP